MGELYQITAPHYCAGLFVNNFGIVKNAAPIIEWANNKNHLDVFRYFRQKGYNIERVTGSVDAPQE